MSYATPHLTSTTGSSTRSSSKGRSSAASSRTQPALASYALVALLTFGFDLATKQLVTATLGDDRVFPLFSRLSLMLVYNTGGAGGIMVGAYTWHLNVVLTVLALGLITSVASALIAVDRRAVLALGLVAGGAAGNLSSMLAGPEGVADFLALHLSPSLTVVMNAADLALWTGALGLAPVVVSLINAIRLERRASASARPQLNA